MDEPGATGSWTVASKHWLCGSNGMLEVDSGSVQAGAGVLSQERLRTGDVQTAATAAAVAVALAAATAPAPMPGLVLVLLLVPVLV
eukprot:474175-Lingulodinium_polyedra.AAC.1